MASVIYGKCYLWQTYYGKCNYGKFICGKSIMSNVTEPIKVFVPENYLFLTVVSLQNDLRISCFGKIAEIIRVEHFQARKMTLSFTFLIRSKVLRIPLWIKQTPFKSRVTYNNENSPFKMVGEGWYLLHRQDFPTPIEPLSFSPPDNPTTDIVT